MSSIFAVTGLLSNIVFAETSVWKISKGNNYFYLGGTVHLLSADDHPLPVEFEEAYLDANIIVFETDLLETQTEQFQSKMMAAMTYSDQRTLAGELSPEVYQKLKLFMATRKIPISNYAKFQPWAISLVITMVEYQRLGMKQQYGVDTFFNNRAIADNKKVVGLETTDEQLSFISSMQRVDADITIEYTLNDLLELPDFIKLMKKSWRSGDVNEFEKSEYVVRMKTEFPEVYDTLLVKRNNNWMDKLPAFINDSSKEFVLVGAMHLNGKEGLLNQLKEQGFKVNQL
ncbi:MAG: TraB/GumN family protein [Psychromonas sp.]|nr:TraB/GumN family protein [Alteromonadales bacterium]MCP5077978.1 TraB/GumN family protein [Psychromonas sp.]